MSGRVTANPLLTTTVTTVFRGTMVPRNTVVTVVVSKGLAVTLPDIHKVDPRTNVGELVAWLLKRGILVEAVPVYDATGDYSSDDVVGLQPPSGTIVYPGDQVTVEVQEDRRAPKRVAAAKAK